jgi:nitrite reductase/ring-hydroxylating ferredoxin subunit
MTDRIPLCRLADLDATGAKGVGLEVAGRWREIVVVRATDGTIRAYNNRCPHLEVTLEARPDRFLDEHRDHLVCAMHGARFRVNDGVCVWGPCEGQGLATVDIEISGDVVMLSEG